MSSWKDDANINRNKLDDECARMPVIYSTWSDHDQRACAHEDRCSHALQLAEDGMKRAAAQAHLQLRSWSVAKINRELGTELDPTRQLTEQIFKDLVLMHPFVKEAEAKLNEARVDFITAKAHRREMQSARYTMDVKDRALKKLVDIGDRLFGMSGSYQPRHSRAEAAIRRESTVSPKVTEAIKAAALSKRVKA